MESAQTIRTALLHDAYDLRIERVSPSSILPDHVAIKPEFCGICGSDLHFYFDKDMTDRLKDPHPLTGVCLPSPLGHEFAGVVTEIGPNSNANDSGEDLLAVGDRVTVMGTLSDGTCWACQNGHANVCSQLGFVGINSRTGGLSDRAVVPRTLVFKLPSSIESDVGALVEPLAVAWHAVCLAGKEFVTPSSAILVLGAGPVGCAVLLCLLARGASKIVVSEPSPGRRDFCERLGPAMVCHPSDVGAALTKYASHRGGFDAVFDCAGVVNSLDTAVQCVRARGSIINLAVQATATIPLFAMVLKEVNLACSLAYTADDYHAVIAAIDSGALKPRAMITKRIPLEDVVQHGLKALRNKDNTECKILIDLNR